MAEQFKCRFEIIRETSTLPTEWIDAVETAIRDVVDDDKLDNESVGLLVSHVVASLDRIHKGNSLTDGPGYELMTEIKSQVPNAEPEAARIVNSIEEWIGLTLPDSEKQYVTLHNVLLTDVALDTVMSAAHDVLTAGKKVVVHADMMSGLHPNSAGLSFLKE